MANLRFHANNVYIYIQYIYIYIYIYIYSQLQLIKSYMYILHNNYICIYIYIVVPFVPKKVRVHMSPEAITNPSNHLIRSPFMTFFVFVVKNIGFL